MGDDALDRLMVVLLVDGLYFKETWMFVFNPKDTTDDEFSPKKTTDDITTVQHLQNT